MWDENGTVMSKSQIHACPRGGGHCEEAKMAKLRIKAFRPKEIDTLDAAPPHETSTRNRNPPILSLSPFLMSPLESPFHLMWSIALAKAESASKIFEKVGLLLDIR